MPGKILIICIGLLVGGVPGEGVPGKGVPGEGVPGEGVPGEGVLPAQPVTILGKHPSYAGKTIHVTISGNPFVPIPRISEEVRCDENGEFRVVLDAREGDAVRLESGIYYSTLFVTPGCRYRITLPEYREVRYADRMSPYFQPLELPPRVISAEPSGPEDNTGSDGIEDPGTGDTGSARTEDPGTGNTGSARTEDPGTGDTGSAACLDGGLNNRITTFDSVFSVINEEVVMDRRLGKDPGADSLIHATEAIYSSDTSLFFRDYRRYRYGILKLNEGKTGLEEISLNYLGPVVRESHPAFMDLFRAMFRDFLFYYSKTPAGEGIVNMINRARQPDTLRQRLMNHPALWSDTLAEMVLLQELTDIFYRGDYHQDAILMLLDSMVHDPISTQLAVYTSQVREKLASLVTGHPPPPLELSGTGGESYRLEDFRGKYIYLVFCTPDHYGCMMEYPFMQSFYKKHAAYLEVVSVMVAEEREQVADFMEKNGYSWKALYYEDQPGILSDYMIKAFPTAYLIGRNGNMILSPAKLPSEGFEQQLFRIMRSRGEV